MVMLCHDASPTPSRAPQTCCFVKVFIIHVLQGPGYLSLLRVLQVPSVLALGVSAVLKVASEDIHEVKLVSSLTG